MNTTLQLSLTEAGPIGIGSQESVRFLWCTAEHPRTFREKPIFFSFSVCSVPGFSSHQHKSTQISTRARTHSSALNKLTINNIEKINRQNTQNHQHDNVIGVALEPNKLH